LRSDEQAWTNVIQRSIFCHRVSSAGNLQIIHSLASVSQARQFGRAATDKRFKGRAHPSTHDRQRSRPLSPSTHPRPIDFSLVSFGCWDSQSVCRVSWNHRPSHLGIQRTTPQTQLHILGVPQPPNTHTPHDASCTRPGYRSRLRSHTTLTHAHTPAFRHASD
jgi:hypothetical protein